MREKAFCWDQLHFEINSFNQMFVLEEQISVNGLNQVYDSIVQDVLRPFLKPALVSTSLAVQLALSILPAVSLLQSEAVSCDVLAPLT